MVWPAEPEDSVIYGEKEYISNADTTFRVVDGKKVDFWGNLYINGSPFGDAGTLNAKAFGAVGNGIVDDTVALQTWLNTSPTKAHYLPTGTYRVTAPLTIPYVQGFTLIGETKLYSIIEMDGNNLPILRTDPDQQWHGHYHLENFRLKYKTAQLASYTSSIGFQFSGHPTAAEGNSFNYCVFRDLKIDNACVGLGIKRVSGKVQNCWNNVFERIDFGCTSQSLIDLRSDVNTGYPVNYFLAITHLGYFEPIKGTGPAFMIDGEFIMDAIDVEDWSGQLLSSIGDGNATLRNWHIERHVVPTGTSVCLFDMYTGSYTVDQMCIDIETAPNTSTNYVFRGGNCGWTIGAVTFNGKSGTAGSNWVLLQPGAGATVRLTGRTKVVGSANWGGLGYYWEGTFSKLNTTAGLAIWDIPSLAVGEMASTTVQVWGARMGDVVAVSMDYQLPAGMQMTGAVYSDDIVAVTMMNHSGAVFDPGAGYAKARIWKDF